jgi:protein-tyrosine-phosphatase
MAAALLDHHAMGRVRVRSAGSAPGDKVNPMAVAALAEWDIDIVDRSPKVLSREDVKASDVVITMGCGDACPVFPGKRYLDWDLIDPSGEDLDVVRTVRDEIDRRVRKLLSEVLEE